MEREQNKPKLIRISKAEYKTAVQSKKEKLTEKYINGTISNDEVVEKIQLDAEDLMCKESECDDESIIVRYFIDCNSGKLVHKIYPKGKLGFGGDYGKV